MVGWIRRKMTLVGGYATVVPVGASRSQLKPMFQETVIGNTLVTLGFGFLLGTGKEMQASREDGDSLPSPLLLGDIAKDEPMVLVSSAALTEVPIDLRVVIVLAR